MWCLKKLTVEKMRRLSEEVLSVRRTKTDLILVCFMYYVYLIQAVHFPEIRYVGYTLDVQKRFKVHNSGGSIHTAKYKPWRLVMYMTFLDELKAKEFEKYLKTQSGRAFANKRLFV